MSLTPFRAHPRTELRGLADKLTAIRLEPMPGSTADAARFIADETALWGKVIAEAHITLQ